jgi:serine phosphatase RsbU (regulator of sigma subunit)
VNGNLVKIRDLGSMNGTFLNGEAVNGERDLAVGDQIRFGQVTLTLTTDEAIAGPLSMSFGTSRLTMSTTMEEIRKQARTSRSDRILAALSDAGQMLSRRMTVKEIHEHVLDLLQRSLTTSRILLLSRDGEATEPRVVASRLADSGLEEPLRLSRSMLSDIVENGRSLLTADALADDQWASKGSIVSLGVRAAMGAPLFDNDRILGAIYVDCRTPGLVYDADDLRLLTLLANVVAVKLTNSRLEEEEQRLTELRRELGLAARIQANLLPKEIPVVPGYEIFAYQAACEQVGGDLYDVRLTEDGKLWLVLGDISGHGVAAALLMANTMAGLHILAESTQDPVVLVSRLEAYLTQHVEMGRFLTLFAGILDPATGHLRFVNAGQNPPLVITAEGRTTLPTTGPPVAIFPGTIPRPAEEVILQPGTLLLVASDGVTEFTRDDQQYDEGRFQVFLDRMGPAGAEEVGRALLKDVDDFGGGAPAADDLTLLLVKRS